MNIPQQIDYWLKSASHDLDTAETLFANKKYDWCLFIGHLVLEKTLKALWVKTLQNIPPRTHNLLMLAEESDLEISDEQRQFLVNVTGFNLEARYPGEKLDFYHTCTREFTEKNFQEIKAFYQWLVKLIKKS
jgi:HEPN domain-containing protein